MLPIGPLMIEHRLIERMITVIQAEIKKIKASKQVDPVFIEVAVDFIRTYADNTHHGKEEDILFRELKKKNLKPDHERIMNELIQEHVFGRETTAKLVKANEAYLAGNAGSIQTIVELLQVLVEFYPKHIEKEDKAFFKPVMKYFSIEEKDAMLEEGQIFDRKMIHKKYLATVERAEKGHELPVEAKKAWLDFV